MKPASAVYSVTPSGSLQQPVTIRISLSQPASDEDIILIGTRETVNDRWSYQPVELSADKRFALLEVDHFSFFTAIKIFTDDLWQIFQEDFKEALTGGWFQNIEKPKCLDEKVARGDGYSVESSKGDTVYWCFGMEDGKRVLKIVDHRRYPLLISYFKGLKVARQDPWWKQLMNLSTASRGLSGDMSVIGSGEEIVYSVDVPAGEWSSAATEFDGLGQSLAALQVGIETSLALVAKVNAPKASLKEAAAAADYPTLFSDLLQVEKCAAALPAVGSQQVGQVLTDCLGEDGLAAIVGKTWAPALSKVLAVANATSFLRGEVNALVDVTTGHDKYQIVIAHAQPTTPKPTVTSSGADVTAADLKTAMVPAHCNNVPAQRLANGESTGNPGQGWLNEPHVAVDLAGLGYKQQLASYGCTAGGIGWPEVLILVGRGGQLLASYDLIQIGKQNHAVVKSMTASGNTATITWDSYDGAGDDVHSYRSKVTYSDGKLVLTTTTR